MNKENYFMFDMDGTLYRFDKGKSENFISSKFCQDLLSNTVLFMQQKLNLSKETAMREYLRVCEAYIWEKIQKLLYKCPEVIIFKNLYDKHNQC